jgi:hypothetical protein
MATLAPASYTPPKSVQVSINGTSSAKDLALFSPKVWVAQGATVDVPFTARLLANGVAQSGQTLNWQIGIGSGMLSPASVMTDANGYGRSTLHLSVLSGDVQGTVCLAPGNNPCQTFYIVQVTPSVLKMQPVSGSFQTIRVGQTFQPISVRVTNSATPPNPVMGVPVVFQSMIFLPDADAAVETSGDGGSSQHAMKVLLGSSQSVSITDNNGLVNLTPSTGGFSRPLEVEIMASAGTGIPLQFELPMLAALAPPAGGSTGTAPMLARLKTRFAGEGAARVTRGTSGEPQRSEEAPREMPLWSAPVGMGPDPAGSPGSESSPSSDGLTPAVPPEGEPECKDMSNCTRQE